MPSSVQSDTSWLWPLNRPPKTRWKIRDADDAATKRLIAGGTVSPLVASIMTARGFVDPGEIEDFLNPALANTHDPLLLKGMTEALDRIEWAIDRGEKIVVYGDYDVDGVTSTVLLKNAFSFLSVHVETHIPHRLREGYGLQADAIRMLAEAGVNLIITVDNGITAVEEVELARSLGVDVVITDHHEPGPTLPAAHALLDPKQPGCEYPFKELCGVGMAFKLAHALLKRKAPDPEAAREFLKSLLDLVALGTVADVVPLIDENRCFVSHGMRLLRNGTRCGLRSLIEVAGVRPEDLNAGRLAFSLGPRINAAGRTDHADRALELLLSKDEAEARELAGMLDRFNEDRRRIEFDMTEEAFSLIDEDSDDPVIVIEQDGWHQGVVGIVASRILDRYYRPAIVLSIQDGWAKGSARSVSAFDIHGAISACSEHLEQFGGHAMAAGMRLQASSLADFRRAINDYARGVMQASDLTPTLKIDAEAAPGDLTHADVEELETLQPFGMKNPRPLFAINGLNLREEPRVLKSKHLKLHLIGASGEEFPAIGFGMGDRAAELAGYPRDLRLAATPFINRWRGRSNVELELKDFTVGS